MPSKLAKPGVQVDDAAEAGSSAVLRVRLRRLRLLVRIALAMGAVGKLAALTLCIWAVSFLLDRQLRLSASQRAVLLAVWAGVSVWQLVRQLIAPLASRLTEEQVAREVEKRCPVPRDLLSSALELARARSQPGGFSPELQAQAVAAGEAAAQLILPREFVNWSAARRSLLLCGACLLAGCLIAVTWPRASGLWLRRNLLLSREQWPSRTRIELLSFSGSERIVPRGEDVEIAVRVHGELPRIARLRLRSDADERPRPNLMKRVGQDVFRTTLPGLRESCTFTVEAGDGLLAPHRLRVAERPRIARAQIRFLPPAYTGKPPRELAWDAPSAEVPVGSTLEFRLTATKPIQVAILNLNDAEPVVLELPSSTTAATAISVTHDVRCAFTVRDTVGLDMAQPLELTVRAVADSAPEVTLAADGVGQGVTAAARLPLLVKATDDHGVDRLWIEARHESGAQTSQLPQREVAGADPPRRELRGEALVDLADLGLTPGGKVTCVARASDRCPPPGPNLGESLPLAFRIVTVQEFLAGLLVRQQDLRQDLEQQMDRQRELLRRLADPAAEGNISLADGVVLASEQRSVAQVLESDAESYRQLLGEMWNNRTVTLAAYERHVGAVVEPLRQTAGQGGAVLRSAGLLSEPESAATTAEAREAVESALATLEAVRSRMLLLETYSQVVVVIQEIAERQHAVLGQTRARYGELVRRILGEED